MDRKCPNCRKTYANINLQPRNSPGDAGAMKKPTKNRRKSTEKSVEKVTTTTTTSSAAKAQKAATPKKGYDFYMYQYKTRPCTKSRCRAAVFCAGFHHQGERRRNPQRHKYSYEPCKYVKEGHRWKDASRCPKGEACDKSHTLLEQMYHPAIYKTSLCTNFPKNQCSWGDFCTHAHGEVRQRTSASS